MEKNTFLMEELKKMFSVRDLVAGGPCVFPESGGKLHLSVGGGGTGCADGSAAEESAGQIAPSRNGKPLLIHS